MNLRFVDSPRTTKVDDSDDKSPKKDPKDLFDVLKQDVSKMNEEDAKDYLIVKKLADIYNTTQKTTTVLSQCFLASVQDINSATGTMKIELNFQLWWIDTDFIGKEGGDDEWGIDTHWKPLVEFLYDVDMEPVGEPSYYIREAYSKYGIINWYQKFKGCVKMNQDLRNFPFDIQNIVIKFGTPVWGDDAVHFEDITPAETCEYFKMGMDLTEWSLVRTPTIVGVVNYSHEDSRDISYIEIRLTIKRRSMYYITNIISLIFLCNVMQWCIFFVNPDELNNRLSLVITLYLALVAINFAVAPVC